MPELRDAIGGDAPRLIPIDICYDTGEMFMWYSICGVHASHDATCKMCSHGRWVPVMPVNPYPLEKSILGRTIEGMHVEESVPGGVYEEKEEQEE